MAYCFTMSVFKGGTRHELTAYYTFSTGFKTKTNESAATYLLLSARKGREAINSDTEKKKNYTPSGKKKVMNE